MSLASKKIIEQIPKLLAEIDAPPVVAIDAGSGVRKTEDEID